jgi:hypothetical protein
MWIDAPTIAPRTEDQSICAASGELSPRTTPARAL